MPMTRVLHRLCAALLAAGLMLLPALPAKAQEISPEHQALAREYVELTDRSRLYELALYDVALATVRTIIQQDPALNEPLQPAIDTVLEHFMDNRSELFDQFARIYASRFTAEELQEILAFYTGPAGSKLLDQNPGINTDLQRVMQAWEANLQTEFFNRVRAELRAAGHSV